MSSKSKKFSFTIPSIGMRNTVSKDHVIEVTFNHDDTEYEYGSSNELYRIILECAILIYDSYDNFIDKVHEELSQIGSVVSIEFFIDSNESVITYYDTLNFPSLKKDNHRTKKSEEIKRIKGKFKSR